MSFVSIAKEFFQAAAKELDPYTSEKSKIKVNSFKPLSMETVAHIQFAKYGRGPGKQPPVDEILKSVKSKGIIFEGLDARGTAWAIARSIAKKGTLNWVPNAPNAVEEALSNHISDYYKKLNGFVLDSQYSELQEIYEKAIPRTITIKI